MENPDAVEVDEKMGNRPLLEISLKERSAPVDTAELHETLCWGHINETRLEEHEIKKVSVYQG